MIDELAGLHLVVRRSGRAPVRLPAAAWAGPRRATIDALTVRIEPSVHGWAWTVAADADTAVDAIALEWDAGPLADPTRVWTNGWQSWSPTGWRTLGVDHDPSRTGALDFLRSVHHADPSVAEPHVLRSEMVTVLDRGSAVPRCAVGFVGGSRHDGTLRIRGDDGRLVVSAEAWLGGAVLERDTERVLHPVMVCDGDHPLDDLSTWAAAVGTAERARVDAPFTTGWCSWYQYFEHVDERDLRDNLARAADWPFAVFQLDDGYQPAVGDWLDTNDRFPSSLDVIAGAIRAQGLTPGIWVAPFLAAPDARLARGHPELLARDATGEPLVSMYNPIWGGFVHGLDPTRAETQSHLERLARELRAAGFDYAKLDFTFAPNVPGVYADRSATPAQRVRAGFDAFRRGFGEDGHLLGCGAPLGACVGVVDGMRVGPDVAPTWNVGPRDTAWPGYEAAAPALRNAWASTAARAFMHRRLWVNDPDCLMLRATDTALTPAQVDGWARAVGASGGTVMVSDDLSLLDGQARGLLDETIAAGRAVDAAAQAGRTVAVEAP